MKAFRTVHIALPFAAPLATVLALSVALVLNPGPTYAASDSADTAARVFSLIAAAPGVSYALDGDIVTVFGHVDDRIEKRRLISALERIDGVSHVRSTIKTD